MATAVVNPEQRTNNTALVAAVALPIILVITALSYYGEHLTLEKARRRAPDLLASYGVLRFSLGVKAYCPKGYTGVSFRGETAQSQVSGAVCAEHFGKRVAVIFNAP